MREPRALRSQPRAFTSRWRIARVGLAVVLALSVCAGIIGFAGGPASVGGAPRGILIASAVASGSPDASGSISPTSTTEPTSSVAPSATATFARMAGTKLRIHFPAAANRFIAVGFHQADNRKAVRYIPTMTCHRVDQPRRTRALLKKDSKLKLFQQALRGRGSSNFSAADCAVKRNTVVLAPVSGIVTNVRHYKLYGRIDDLRVEIKPDGAPKLRVVEIHIKSVKVKKGDRVIGGVTPVAIVRHLPLDSTVNHYIPVSPADHVHVQVNLATFKGSY